MSELPRLRLKIPEKLESFLEPRRYKIAYGGRGSAKSWTVARLLLQRGTIEPLRILCAREIQNSIEESVHQLLRDQVEILGLDSFYDVGLKNIRGANGTEFFFTGLHRQTVSKIKSYEGVDIVWVEEAQTVAKRSWDILIPTIRKPGSEIWITFNPDLDTDETFARFVMHPPPDAAVQFINYRDNPWFPDVLEGERLHCKVADPEGYENIWEGKCRAAVEGAIYALEVTELQSQGRYCPIAPDPLLKVHTVWDLGWNDLMVVGMWQRSPQGMMLIDSIICSHTTYAEVVKMLERRDYRWGYDFLPHDGKHRNPQTGKGADDILRELGRNVREVPNVGVEAGIKMMRQGFGKFWIAKDVGDNEKVLHALKRYRRQINQATNEPMGPLHDESSHPADMGRYAFVVADQMTNDEPIGDFNRAFRDAASF